MPTQSATNSTFRYWIFLAIALSFLFAGLTASAIGFVFTQLEWMNTAIYAAIIMLNSLSVVLVIPRLLSLALCGRDIQKLKDSFS